MKLTHQFIQLREHFLNISEQEEILITVDELADILLCTRRNVLLILKKMSAANWLQWNPVRGRGNRSRLVFLIPTDQLVLMHAKNLIHKKDVKGALEHINGPSIPSIIKSQFHDWLYSYFGHQSEVKNHKTVDTLRFPLSGPIVSLDPMQTHFAMESHLVKQIFDSLVKYSAITHTIEPHLAHYWEVDGTRTEWTFYLRKGVLFHHGKEMDANDVAFSLNRPRFRRESTLYRWVYDQIDHVEAIASNILYVKLSQPNELFLPFLSTSRAAIVPKDVCEASVEQFNKAPIGTGPFRWISHDRSICILEAFPSYFQGRAHLDRVEIWNIPDLYETENSAQLESFQLIHNMKVQQEKTQNQVKSSGTTCKFITFNQTKQSLISDPTLRKTLIRMIEPTELIHKMAEDGQSLFKTEGFLTSNEPLHHSQHSSLSGNVPRRVSDYGEILKLCTITHYEQDAKLIQQLCQQAGISIHIILLSPEEFKGEKRLQADMILFAVMLDHDQELRLIDLYKSMQQHLQGETKNKLEKYILRILAEPNPSQRRKLFEQTDQLLKDQRVIHFLYKKHLKTAYHPSVKGISLDSIGWVQFKDIWFQP